MVKEFKVKCPRCQKVVTFRKVGTVNGWYGWTDQSEKPPYHILYVSLDKRKIICPYTES